MPLGLNTHKTSHRVKHLELKHGILQITSFNTAKNVRDESANKLIASKLLAYNGMMPIKIYNKIKVIGILMPLDLQR